VQSVLDYLKKNEQRFIQQLCDYVSLSSVSAQSQHKQDLANCANWLTERCRKIGLQTEMCPTEGNPVVVARTPRKGSGKPHYVVYGHYDVQPAEPFELWKSAPLRAAHRRAFSFRPGRQRYKGQHLAHLNAVEAYLQTGTDLPCDLTFVIEGEEEVGSKSLGGFLRKHAKDLRCDGIVISDNGIPAVELPALTYALRGIIAAEIVLHGPSRDLHSGIYGGSVDNPAMALCQLLAKMRDHNGRVTIPGFYDKVVPLSRYERQQLARLPHADAGYKRFLGVPELFGEKGYTSTERRTAGPRSRSMDSPAVTREKAARRSCRPGLGRSSLSVLCPTKSPTRSGNCCWVI
jgi:acetylornithine deacetylase/succinyl-diaminopimelate desuccinylase-like protein